MCMCDFVYHYTSLEALKGIIGENDVCLWATKYDCLNDPLEQTWAQQVVFKEIREMDDYKTMSDEEISAFHSKFPYTISLCKACDSRVMWRLYANDGLGVMLVFESKVLADIAKQHTWEDPANRYEIFAPVVYANDQNILECIHKSLTNAVYSELDEEEANKLARACSFVKHEDFRCESEIRYAVSREFKNIRLSYNKENDGAELSGVTENTTDVKYRIRGNEIVPYLEVHLPACSLKKVIVGYQHEKPLVACQYIRDYLDSKSKRLYKNVDVEMSKIKYNV